GVAAAVPIGHGVFHRILAGEAGRRLVDRRAARGIPGHAATLHGCRVDRRHLQAAILAHVVHQQILAVEVVGLAGNRLVEVVGDDDRMPRAGARRGLGRVRRRGAVADLDVDGTGIEAAVLVHHRVFDGVLALPVLQRGVLHRAVAAPAHAAAGRALRGNVGDMHSAILAHVIEQHILGVEPVRLVDTDLVVVIAGDYRMAGAAAARRIGRRRIGGLRRRGAGANLDVYGTGIEAALRAQRRTLFPYTALFRSQRGVLHRAVAAPAHAAAGRA